MRASARRSRIFAFLTCLVLSTGSARAEERRPLPPLGEPPWEALHFPKIDRHTRYELRRSEGGPSSLRSESDCAASAYLLPLEDVDLVATPRLAWRWRIHRGLANDEEQTKAGDDFAARVYLLFEFDPRRASLSARIARRAVLLLYGRELPGEAINYVWASRMPVGARWPNPFSESAHMVVLRTRSDAPGASAWHSEEVDLSADRGALLGEPLPRLAGIALMTDSDNSCSRAAAEFADFRLLGPSDDSAAASAKDDVER
jgi:hypothetical protein